MVYILCRLSSLFLYVYYVVMWTEDGSMITENVISKEIKNEINNNFILHALKAAMQHFFKLYEFAYITVVGLCPWMYITEQFQSNSSNYDIAIFSIIFYLGQFILLFFFWRK